VGLTVAASDPEGHEVSYSIDPGFQDGNFFAVSESDGIVTLAQSLDRDPPFGHDMFTFNVLATDMPGEGEASRTGTVQVVVTVDDVNDNEPEITQPELSLITLKVQEVVAILATELFTMSASDVDGDSDGDSITYSLDASDDSLMFFAMDPTSGVFRQTTQVDREACDPVPCHYEMTATACDGASTPMCSSISVTVTVQDYNDNPPVITNDPLTATEPVLEASKEGWGLAKPHKDRSRKPEHQANGEPSP
jgi:hypothetical protein